MLKTIDPVLTPDLLWVLAAMGHGDDLALVDANHPAQAIAAETTSGELIQLPGLAMGRAARAILSVFPLDDFVDDPVRTMEVVGEPGKVPPIRREVQAEIDKAETGRKLRMVGIERHAFYEAAKSAFAIVQVGDPRFYGCFLFKKGAIEGTKP